MEISKENNQLVIKIPLRQKIYNSYMPDEDLGETDNLVGIIVGDEFTISQLIDMDYKSKDDQEGMPIIHFNSKEELEAACKIGNIKIWGLPPQICAYCNKTIRGSFTIGEKGNQCWECENKSRGPD